MKVLSCYLGIKFFDRHRRLNYLQSKKATQLVSQQYFHHFLQTFIQFKRTELGFCVLKRQKQIVLIVCSMHIHSSVPAKFHKHLQSCALQGPSQNTAYNYFTNVWGIAFIRIQKQIFKILKEYIFISYRQLLLSHFSMYSIRHLFQSLISVCKD